MPEKFWPFPHVFLATLYLNGKGLITLLVRIRNKLFEWNFRIFQFVKIAILVNCLFLDTHFLILRRFSSLIQWVIVPVIMRNFNKTGLYMKERVLDFSEK